MSVGNPAAKRQLPFGSSSLVWRLSGQGVLFNVVYSFVCLFYERLRFCVRVSV